jgi:hypothetical protein
MTLALILVVIVLTLAASAIFYAWHMTGTLILKTVVAAVGFLILFITLALAGLL